MRGRRLRSYGQPFVHGAAFVGLEMAEGDPAQLLRRQDARQCLAVEREHLAQAGVEHQRLVAHDEELVEGEAGRRRDVGHKGGKTEDAVRDFRNPGFHDVLTVKGTTGWLDRRQALDSRLNFIVHICVLNFTAFVNIG